MLGDFPSNQFIPKIASQVGVSLEIATQIAEDVNQMIIMPIRNQLKTNYGSDQYFQDTAPVILDKTTILNEIENPTSTPSIAVNPTPIYPTEPIVPINVNNQPAAPSIAEQKLTTITHKPTENVVDPYREPIN
jgi:hypothetical protein